MKRTGILVACAAIAALAAAPAIAAPNINKQFVTVSANSTSASISFEGAGLGIQPGGYITTISAAIPYEGLDGGTLLLKPQIGPQTAYIPIYQSATLLLGAIAKGNSGILREGWNIKLAGDETSGSPPRTG